MTASTAGGYEPHKLQAKIYHALKADATDQEIRDTLFQCLEFINDEGRAVEFATMGYNMLVDLLNKSGMVVFKREPRDWYRSVAEEKVACAGGDQVDRTANPSENQ